MVKHNGDVVDKLLYKIVIEEGLDNIQNKLQQPIESKSIIKRESFSDPMFARKFQELKKAQSINSYRYTGHRGIKKLMIKVEKTFKVIK